MGWKVSVVCPSGSVPPWEPSSVSWFPILEESSTSHPPSTRPPYARLIPCQHRSKSSRSLAWNEMKHWIPTQKPARQQQQQQQQQQQTRKWPLQSHQRAKAPPSLPSSTNSIFSLKSDKKSRFKFVNFLYLFVKILPFKPCSYMRIRFVVTGLSSSAMAFIYLMKIEARGTQEENVKQLWTINTPKQKWNGSYQIYCPSWSSSGTRRSCGVDFSRNSAAVR